METRSMRRNKYSMKKIDRLEEYNKKLMDKNKTLEENNSVLSRTLSALSKSTHIPSLKAKMKLRRSARTQKEVYTKRKL